MDRPAPPLLLIIIALFSLKLGTTGAQWADVWHSFGPSPEGQAEIIANFRLPRIAIGVIVGIHFGLAGMIMQIVLRNPLADPTIFGISSGASLAVITSIVISLSTTGSLTSQTWLPYIALAGGLVATGLVFLLSWNKGFSPARMTLHGVVLGSILSAIVMALVLSLPENSTQLAIVWLAGSFYGRGFEHLLPVLPWTMVAVVITASQTRTLSLLRFDNATSRSLGLNVVLAQTTLVLLAAALASSAVAIAGPIGFVGLLVPHMARMLSMRSMPLEIWLCMFLGALLVVSSDTLGRIIAPPREVPVGIITSIIGAPIFAIILSWGLRKSNAFKS